MSDRLVELLRQKKLLQEHINWLDQEIARTATSALNPAATPPTADAEADAPVQTPVASAVATRAASPNPSTDSRGTAASPASAAKAPSPAADTRADNPADDTTKATAPSPERGADAMRMADEIIARYQQEDALRPEDTKRGCLILAGALFALLGLAFLISYWLFYRSNQ